MLTIKKSKYYKNEFNKKAIFTLGKGKFLLSTTLMKPFCSIISTLKDDEQYVIVLFLFSD